jgi:hypothetical protein
LRQLARKIGDTFIVYKYKSIEFSGKFNKLPGTSRTFFAEHIQYLIDPIQSLDLLVIIISILRMDSYIGLFLFLFLPGDNLIIYLLDHFVIRNLYVMLGIGSG